MYSCILHFCSITNRVRHGTTSVAIIIYRNQELSCLGTHLCFLGLQFGTVFPIEECIPVRGIVLIQGEFCILEQNRRSIKRKQYTVVKASSLLVLLLLNLKIITKHQ